jgi:hypothetical protein
MYLSGFSLSLYQMLAEALERRKRGSSSRSSRGDVVSEQCEIERKRNRQMHRYQWRYPCDTEADLASRRRLLAIDSIEQQQQQQQEEEEVFDENSGMMSTKDCRNRRFAFIR